jgi:hypothetical protein
MPAKQNSGRLSAKANHVGVFRGLESSHSQNEVAGTRHLLAGLSQRRQCGLAVLRMFVTAVVPNWGGQGIPHRIIVSSRSPDSPLSTTSAMPSGKVEGNGSRLPAVSRVARVNSRIACWVEVTAQRLHMWDYYAE